jgi:hypothetical protein
MPIERILAQGTMLDKASSCVGSTSRGRIMAGMEEQFPGVLEDIESAPVKEYEAKPGLVDSRVVFALDNAVISINQDNGYGKGRSVSTDADVVAGSLASRKPGRTPPAPGTSSWPA